MPVTFNFAWDSLGCYIEHGRTILAGPFCPPPHHLVRAHYLLGAQS